MKSSCRLFGAVAMSLACICATSPAKADNPSTPQLRLVPTPRNVKLDNGTYTLAGNVAIVAGAEDSFAAQQIADEIKTDSGQSIPIARSDAGLASAIVLQRDRG